MNRIISPLVAALQVRQRTAVRQQIAMLRMELRRLQEAHGKDGSHEARVGRYMSIQGLRRSILRTEFVEKELQLTGLLNRATELGLNLEEDRETIPTGSPLAAKSAADDKWIAGRRFKALAAVVLLAIAVVAIVTRALDAGWLSNAATVPVSHTVVELAPPFNALAEEQGKIFFTREIKLDYAGGRVILSGAPSPVGPFSIDDAMALSVTRPDGSNSRWARTFNVDCYSNSLVDAQDLTWMFLPGVNTVRVELSDVCGATWGTSGAIVLTNVPE